MSSDSDMEQNNGNTFEESDSADEEQIWPGEDLVDDLTYDVYNLTACNYHTIRLESKPNKEKQLLSLAQRSTQLLIKRYNNIC